MSDTQSVYHVVLRYDNDDEPCLREIPVKIFSARSDARKYAEVMNREHDRYDYYVYEKGVKLG